MIKQYQLVIVLLAGLLLRLLFPMDRAFDFDQEQIAVNAQKILSGKLTLIGPQTGPIQFFTGPLIYYLAAGSYGLTGGHPLANTLTGVGVYLISAVILWYGLRRLIRPPAMTIFLGLYAVSPYLVSLDRMTWNPNLSFLSAGLVLSALLFARGKWAWVMGFLGMWLAYQAHFSAFVMAVSVVLISLFLKRFKFLLASLSGLAVSLLPTFIFDIRHDWLNLNGLMEMVTKAGLVSGGIKLHTRLFNNLLISLENVTKIILPQLPQWSLVGLGVLILFVWLRSKPGIFNQSQRVVLAAWLLIFPLVMMFYRGSVPEYYFLMQLPAGVFILTDLLMKVKVKPLPACILVAIFLITLGIVVQQAKALALGSSLKNKLTSLEYIQKNHDDQPVALVLDMGVGDRFGWQYLIDYTKLSLGENQTKAHLIYPVNLGAILSARFGGIGVWLDKRGTVDAQAFVDDHHGILFYYPNDHWQLNELERVIYPQNTEIRLHAFAPQDKAGASAVQSGILYGYLPKNSAHKYFQDLEEKNKHGNLGSWEHVGFIEAQLTDRKTLTREGKDDLFIFSFPLSYSWQQIESFLPQVEGL